MSTRTREGREESRCPTPVMMCIRLGPDFHAAGTHLELHHTVEVVPQHLFDGHNDVLLHSSAGQHCKSAQRHYEQAEDRRPSLVSAWRKKTQRILLPPPLHLPCPSAAFLLHLSCHLLPLLPFCPPSPATPIHRARLLITHAVLQYI